MSPRWLPSNVYPDPVKSMQQYVAQGGTLKIFYGYVPFFGFQWQPALENLAEKDTRL